MDPKLNVTSGSLLRLELPCDLQAVRPAVEACRRFLENQNLDENSVIACELALAEACNNAVEYADEAGQTHPVQVQILWTDDALELQVLDHAPGFEWPTSVMLPGTASEHGRGLFIIQSLMDEVSYLKGADANCLLLRKWLMTGAGKDPGGPETQVDWLPSHGYAASNNREGTPVHDPLNSSPRPSLEHYLVAHELQIARNIQQSLLPQALPSLPGLALSGYCLSAREVGGDFYDILPLANDNVLLVVADVMGKGVPAALFAATFRTLVRTMADLATRPAELLSRINRLMFSELSGVDMFITAQLALVQTHESRLVIASAGHCPVLCANEQGESCMISPEGMPLGILREAIYKEDTLALHDGSRVVFYTDGLIETRNPRGEFLGQAKLMQWLCEGVSLGLPAPELKEMFLAGLQQFQGSTPPTDDQTLLILEQKAARTNGAEVPLREALQLQVP